MSAIIRSSAYLKSATRFIQAAAAEPPEEITHLAALLYSAQGDEQTFFEMKRVLECAFPEARLRAESKPKSYEHPSRAASIHSAERVIGRLFELHPSLLAAEGIEGRAVLFDIDLRQAFGIASRKQASYKPLRKYPTSSFDLSVIAAMETPVAEIEEQLSGAASNELASMHFIRQYSGPPLQEGQKSVSYRLEIGAPDHTLTSEEVPSYSRAHCEGDAERRIRNSRSGVGEEEPAMA